MKFRPFKRLPFFGTFLIFLLILSCTKEDFGDANQNSFEKENFVSLKEAKAIVSEIQLIRNTRSSYPKKSDSRNILVDQRKSIKNAFSIEDDNGHDAFHIINFTTGGFMIISGDNRTVPVLAFSDRNNFSLDSESYPNGLVGWLVSVKQNVEKLRRTGEMQNAAIAAAWETNSAAYTIYNIPPEDLDDGFPCGPPNSVVYGPFLKTTWSQGVGYNNLVPITGCSNYSNGRAPTGCVATAMAQIMKYHEYPNSYNWNSMPNSYGTSETSQLMVDIGYAVDMNYSCNGSGANTENKAPSAFKNTFGYQSADYADFNTSTVANELKNGRPVILTGGRKTGWWAFPIYTDGHAWVCDGYRHGTVYSPGCETSWDLTYLHMNWGWGSGHNMDGWYTTYDWSPGDNSFNYDKGMVFNIKPQ